MTCANTSCSIFPVCQNKTRKPCPASRSFKVHVVHNGYRAMAAQEQQMRNSSIEFKGDF
jgi:hypothetical protein